MSRRRDEGDVLVVPLHEERVRVAKRAKERYRVRVTKRVETRDEVVVAASVREDVRIERVPVNRTVSDVPTVRYEGTTIIVPIVEETFVVEKKLVLREELRISRVPVHEPRSVTVSLRREVADVRRVDGDGDVGSKSNRKEGQHANGGRFVRKSQRGERDAR